jgi:hypothetical protein
LLQEVLATRQAEQQKPTPTTNIGKHTQQQQQQQQQQRTTSEAVSEALATADDVEAVVDNDDAPVVEATLNDEPLDAVRRRELAGDTSPLPSSPIDPALDPPPPCACSCSGSAVIIYRIYTTTTSHKLMTKKTNKQLKYVGIS